MYLDKAKKEEIFGQYGKNAEDTGSAEAQIALFSYRISHLTEHLKKNHKDHNTARSLTMLVGKRRKLLKYLYIIIFQGNLGFVSLNLSFRNPYNIGPGKLPKRLVIKRFKEDPAPLCSLGILLTTYPPIIGSKALAKKKNKKSPIHKNTALLE